MIEQDTKNPLLTRHTQRVLNRSSECATILISTRRDLNADINPSPSGGAFV